MTTIDEDKITLAPIVSDDNIENAKEIYLEAFPPAEQRPWDKILSRCDGRLTLTGIFLNQHLAGIITSWIFDEFLYVEHFVVDPTMRSQGIGSAAMRILQRQCAPLPIVLEVEPEHLSPQAARRVKVYQRLGFHIIDRSYVQPPYDTFLPPVHLWLMSTDPNISPSKASLLLHREVYNVTEA